jgi:DNA (cytosine-5)-methyltransferase 3A
MKILSLFDGISIAQQALKNIGAKVDLYMASEIDKYAIQIAQKNFPDTVQLGSVVGLSGSYFDNIDLLIGGSPCQDLSIAKKGREGLSGSRSGLFWEYVRILKEVKPRYFVLENVNSMPKEAKDLITKTLGVEPIMINAALVSAQNRKRLFWTNIPNVTQPEDRGILLRDILEPKVDDGFIVKPKSNTVRSSGMASGIDHRHNWDTIRIGQIGKGGQGDRIYSPDGKSVNLSANGGGRGAKTGLYAVKIVGRRLNENGTRKDNDKTIPIKQRVEINENPQKTNTLSTVQKDNAILENSVVRKLTPIECERLQSLPDNYTEGVSNTQRYKALGNGFNCAVIEHILKNIL